MKAVLLHLTFMVFVVHPVSMDIPWNTGPHKIYYGNKIKSSLNDTNMEGHSPQYRLPQYLLATGPDFKKTKNLTFSKQVLASSSTAEKPTHVVSISFIIAREIGIHRTDQLVLCLLSKTLSLIQNQFLQ